MPPLDPALPNRQIIIPVAAYRHGLSINENYCWGKAYVITVKLAVRETIKTQDESLDFVGCGSTM